MGIRACSDDDIDAVLALNEESVSALSPLDREDLAAHRVHGTVLVSEVDAEVAGFAVAYGPGAPYRSVNYAWFSARYADFFYLDRIAVSKAYRRRGIATALYDAMEARAARHGRMGCEVNSQPVNVESLEFHRRRGYIELGHLIQPDGHETVMLEKVL